MPKRVGAALVVVVCCVQFLGLRLEAQNVSVVRGRVLDARGAPVVRVKVTLGKLWGYSDASGQYVFSRVPFGTYTVAVERGGQTIAKRQIVVNQRLTEVPDLRLP